MRSFYFRFFLMMMVFVSCKLSPFGSVPDFEENEPDFEIEEDSALFEAIEEKVVFESNETKYLRENGTTIWCVKKENESPDFEEIKTTLSKQSGKAEAGYGIIFLQQEYENKDFLITLMINTKGEFILGKVVDGSFIAIKNWQPCSYLNKGYGVKNTIQISESENLFAVIINGYNVADFTISEKIKYQGSKSGYVVVISGNERFPDSSVKVMFSNGVED